MRRKVCTALSFSWYERWVLLEAWVLLLVVDLGLRVLPFRWVQRLVTVGRQDVGDGQAAGTPATVRHLQWLVGVAGRNHVYPMRCLQQALALQWLLGRRGIASDLQIGVRKAADGLEAHAWLEWGGRPVGEPMGAEGYYAPLVIWGANG